MKGVSPDGMERRLLDRLVALRRRRAEDPGFNPVWRLASELSFALEAGEVGRGGLCRLAEWLLDRSLVDRGTWVGAFLAPMERADNLARVGELLERDCSELTYADFAARWESPAIHAVFTAHPTFLLDPVQSARVVAVACGDKADRQESAPPVATGDGITLGEEHAQAMQAIGNARQADAALCRTILEHARRVWPDEWRALRPRPTDLATWVGYDMDGRTDIGWADCVRLRLMEKRLQLDWYLRDIETILERAGDAAVQDALAGLKDRLTAAREHTDTACERLSGDLDDAATLRAAADWMTAPAPGRFVTVAPLLEGLDAALEIAGAQDVAVDIAVLRAQMANFRLGVGRVHFRINATQLHNAIRRAMTAEDEDVDLASRTALQRLNALCADIESRRVNFAALAMETTTAVRQFLTMAQFSKHIDADSDIRLLIAETERPATVLAAIYYARMFGLEERIDISPLFETPPALEGGERFLDVLLQQPAYRAAVERRGRIAIQTGFSDAGRFIGQIPASLAIERLQGNLARLMESHGLGHLDCVIFNTHGESMGRGAHHGSVAQRLDHVLTPWARRQFAARGLRLRHETSFQGGDGYLWFARPEMALAMFTRTLEHLRGRNDESLAAPVSPDEDPVYTTPDLSLDFYRRVLRFQESLMRLGAYHRSLTSFALSLLRTTGSRKTRRQFESSAAERPDLSRIRAIPHNAALQQLGYPVNVIGGIGQATRGGCEPYCDWRRDSRRFSSLMDMVVSARKYGSLRTLIAYGTLFDGGYWASRPHGAGQAHLTEACLYLADRFESDDRYVATLELTTRLRIDELLLHRLLDSMNEASAVQEAEERDFFALLHALRIALVQHLFLMAARIPRFSARNDISREDIMELIFELRIPEAVSLLRQAYPRAAPLAEDFGLEEPADYPDTDAPGYTQLNRRLIDPMEDIHRCLLTISTAIANGYRAHG